MGRVRRDTLTAWGGRVVVLGLMGCGLLGTQAEVGTPPKLAPQVQVPSAPADPPAALPAAPAPAQVGPRAKLAADGRYALTHLVVAWAGAVGAPPDVTRTEAEAKQRAEQLRERATREPLEELARQHSDDRSGRRGGQLGVWRAGALVPELEQAVAELQVGQLGQVVRTPFGWHVVRRAPVHEVEVAHLQVAWAGARRADTPRSREQAQARIQAAAQRLQAGADFAALADELSDDDGAGPGGALGVIPLGQMVPAFEDAAYALAPGQISGVVETPYGFHLIHRIR